MLYDGQCEFCRRSVRLLQRLDRRGRLHFADGRDPANLPQSSEPLDPRRLLEEMLEQHGIVRRSMLTVPNTVVAAEMAAKTDWILTTPEAIAPRLCAMFPLQRAAFPFDGPELWLDIIWHRRSDRDPMHRWVRSAIAETISHI